MLGDACHAMLPFMAQGAAQAIEDAATLTAVLAEADTDVPAALRTELAVLVGTLRTTPQVTGSRLLDFTPDPEPAPKKDEK